MRRIVLGLALAVAVVATAGADQTERLEAIRAEIEQREKRARDWAAQAQGELAQLEAIDRQLAEARRSLRRLRKREKDAQAELADARAGERAASEALEAIERDLSSRLVALYKFSSSGGVTALTSAGNAELRARRRHGLSRVLAQDRRLFARHRTARTEWERSRERGELLVAEIGGARRAAAMREEFSRAKLVERRNFVALMRSRSRSERRAAQELRDAAKRLERALAELPAQVDFAGEGLERGRVRWPVRGPVRLAYGRQRDPQFGTQTLRNGIEIEAPQGAPVRAVADGRVLFAGWFRGYGQVAIVDHGGGDLTVLGYLDELAVEKGEMVRGGQAIGTVGETGSLGGPGLYFEIRRAGRAEDPEAWLGS